MFHVQQWVNALSSWHIGTASCVLLQYIYFMVGVGGVAPDVTDLRQKQNIDDTSSDEYHRKIFLRL